VGDAAAIQRSAGLVASQIEQGDEVIVVVSAMAGITDLLVACAEQAAKIRKGSYFATISGIRAKFEDTIKKLFQDVVLLEELSTVIDSQMNELEDFCGRVNNAESISPGVSDQINSIGELLTIQVFSAVLKESGLLAVPINSSDLILTDNEFSNAAPIQPDCDQRIRAVLLPVLAAEFVPVVSGYIGGTTAGEITTLGRGGGDYSAAILGAAMEVDQVCIWTDVDGVMTTDPDDIFEARLISNISYEEAYELTHFGAKVLHPKTIQPLREHDIPILVKNTFKPKGEGTNITSTKELERASIKAVAGIKQVSVIVIKRRPGEDRKSIIEAARQALQHFGLEVLRVFHQPDKAVIYLAVHGRMNPDIIDGIEDALSQHLPGRNFSRIKTLENYSLVTAVGNRLLQNQQLIARLNLALEMLGIRSFRMGMQTSSNSLSFLVPDGVSEKVLKHFHNEVLRYA
jgi:aspartate kinase